MKHSNNNNQKKKNKSSHSKETNSTEKSLQFFQQCTKWFLIYTKRSNSQLIRFIWKASSTCYFWKCITQKIGPSYSPDGPILEFEYSADRNNFTDLQRTRLVKKIVQNMGNVLRTHATEAAQQDTPYLINNPLPSFFPNAQWPWMEKQFHQLMPIVPIRVSLKLKFNTLMMQRTHGLLVKVIIVKIIHQVLMVLMGELKMSRNVSES